MTLATTLHTLRWTHQDLARALDLSDRTIRRWIAGQAVVPGPVLAWLDDLAAYHLSRPAPVGNKR